MAAFRKRDCRNAVGKHFHNHHAGLDVGGLAPAFDVEILGGWSSNMERYIGEGVWIEEGVTGGGAEMNSKGEWGRINTRRIGVLDTIAE